MLLVESDTVAKSDGASNPIPLLRLHRNVMNWPGGIMCECSEYNLRETIAGNSGPDDEWSYTAEPCAQGTFSSAW